MLRLIALRPFPCSSGNFPKYDKTQGFEIAGLCWHQGWNDHVSKKSTAEYTENIEHLINDLRHEFRKEFVEEFGIPR